MKRASSLSHRLLNVMVAGLVACGGASQNEGSGAASSRGVAGGTTQGPSAAATQLIVNGGFEEGTSGWTLAGTTSVIAGGRWSHGGASVANFCDKGTANTASLRQNIAIPANATTAQLSFWVLIFSNDTSGSAAATIEAKVIDGANSKTLGSWDDMDNATNGNYVQGTYDLSAYRGKTVTLAFEATEKSGGSAGFYLDDVSLMVDTGSTTSPSISSFNPANGKAGTQVTISGVNFTGVTAVKFNGVNATFTAQSATQISATVPTGATTGAISVITPNGTANSASVFTIGSSPVGTVDFYVAKIEIGQATQRPDNSMRLAQDRRAYIRVFMQADQANSMRPSVLVQVFQNGAEVYQTTITAPIAMTGVPTAAAGEGDFDQTWNDIIPANFIMPGMSVKVTADPTQTEPDSNRGNNVYPATGTLPMDVKNTYPFRLSLVPLEVYTNGSYWSPYIGNTDDWTVMFQRIWPVPENLELVVHSTYSTSLVPLADYSYGWDETLNELLALAAAEGASNWYYYGAYSPYYGTGGGSGMAFLGQPVAMGIDWDMISHTFTWKSGTVAHELGHSLNRPHTACGGAAEPDPNFPYADGSIGTWGYDMWTDEWYDPALFADVMGYCGYSWVSDYSVDMVMDFRLSGDTTVPGPVPGPTTKVPSTLVWGRVVNGEVQMNPSFTIQAVPRPMKGSYQAELVSASGQVMGSAQFEPASTDNGNPNVKGFVLVVPLDQTKGITQAGAAAVTPATIRISRNGAVQATQKANAVTTLKAASADASALSAKKVGGDRVQLRWDVKSYPMIMVKNAKGEVIGMGRNGQASVLTKDARLEVHLSDGTQSQAVLVNVQ